MDERSLRFFALVTDVFGEYGGIARYNRDLLSALAVCEGVGEVIILPRAGATSPGTLPSCLRQLHPVKSKLRYSLAAFGIAQQYRPIDIVFCGHLFMVPLAAMIARLLGARLWVQVHGIDAWQELSGLYRRSVEMAALITSVSRYTRARMLEWVSIEPARVKVLPTTVDPRFQPGSKPGYLLDRHAVHGKKVLLTVSRLAAAERYKGHDHVIRVLPRVLVEHPETMYLIAGDGDDRPRLKALAEEVRVAQAVRLLGSVSDEELADHFRMADVFVMPSTGEGFGIAFLEAMASGIRVIGGNKDGSLDPLGDGVLGTAIDPENGDELASAICTALSTAPANADCALRFKASAFTEHLQALVWSNFIAGH